ncbi:hypothetical protein ACWENQ_31620 [Nonomuraea sp. NPDC004354]
MAAIRIAANRSGLSVIAYVAETAVAVAEERLVPVPVDRRGQMAEFVRARVELNRIGRALESGRDAELLQCLADVRVQVTPAVWRVEAGRC